METAGFLEGVPLALMKKGLFARKAGTVFQLAKLVFNGKAYTFTAATRGAVALNAAATDWWFVAPDGRFDFDGLGELTAGGFLEAVAASCDGTPVPAWDEFAAWLSESGTVELVNSLFSQVSRVECGGTSAAAVPAFTAPGERISGLLNWLLAVLNGIGAAEAMPMSAARVHSRKFAIPVNIYTAADDGTERLLSSMTFSFQQ